MSWCHVCGIKYLVVLIQDKYLDEWQKLTLLLFDGLYICKCSIISLYKKVNLKRIGNNIISGSLCFMTGHLLLLHVYTQCHASVSPVLCVIVIIRHRMTQYTFFTDLSLRIAYNQMFSLFAFISVYVKHWIFIHFVMVSHPLRFKFSAHIIV